MLAVARMYLLRDFAFIPLVVTCNKMLLASYSYYEKYLKLIQQQAEPRGHAHE
jgi:hypothetical protein